MTRPNGDYLDPTSADSRHYVGGNFPGTAITTCGSAAPECCLADAGIFRVLAVPAYSAFRHMHINGAFSGQPHLRSATFLVIVWLLELARRKMPGHRSIGG
jgi:hypothetical protein